MTHKKASCGIHHINGTIDCLLACIQGLTALVVDFLNPSCPTTVTTVTQHVIYYMMYFSYVLPQKVSPNTICQINRPQV